jgi:hypothetical protein
MKEVNLKLSLSTYNTIIQALQEMPWKLAHPVFQEIDPQIRAALAKSGQKGSNPSTSTTGEKK